MSTPNPENPKLEAQIYFILRQAGVKDADHDACLKWAFGPDAWEIPINKWPDRWFKLHPRATQVSGADSFVQVVFMVGFYYAQQRMKSAIGPNTEEA